MKKNHKLAQAISDSAWYSFVLKLSYKAQFLGKTILKISLWEPSTKNCNVCGYHSATRCYVMNCVNATPSIWSNPTRICISSNAVV